MEWGFIDAEFNSNSLEDLYNMTIILRETGERYSTNGVIKIIPDIGGVSFFDKNTIEETSGCFGPYLRWYYVLSKEVYSQLYRKKDLLKLPAFKVQELEDESLKIQIYENPLEYDSSEAIEYMRSCADYLNEHVVWS